MHLGNLNMKQMNKQNGFTLMELMITFAIIAILVTIAIPAYSDYVKRARIIEATAALSDTSIKLDQFFLDNRTYVGYGNCPSDTTTVDYTCALSSNGFALSADGVGEMAGFDYGLNEQNVKSSTTAWGDNPTCWVRAKGGKC